MEASFRVSDQDTTILLAVLNRILAAGQPLVMVLDPFRNDGQPVPDVLKALGAEARGNKIYLEPLPEASLEFEKCEDGAVEVTYKGALPTDPMRIKRCRAILIACLLFCEGQEAYDTFASSLHRLGEQATKVIANR